MQRAEPIDFKFEIARRIVAQSTYATLKTEGLPLFALAHLAASRAVEEGGV